jgi:hypothetical protein
LFSIGALWAVDRQLALAVRNPGIEVGLMRSKCLPLHEYYFFHKT